MLSLPVHPGIQFLVLRDTLLMRQYIIIAIITPIDNLVDLCDVDALHVVDAARGDRSGTLLIYVWGHVVHQSRPGRPDLPLALHFRTH
jgi:hypothetical protein